MREFWRDLSVVKKLYAVVGVMAFLVAIELLTLIFATSTLSTLRAMVGGEGSWSKAQKDAIYSLYRYADTKDEKHYEDFNEYLKVPEADKEGRTELLSNKEP
ncbi:MAG TPA: hypothetical protein VN132_14700, partial [Bdellovibrio sp.]|nr:hypothetical protein [Bdellovibrio sp.]